MTAMQPVGCVIPVDSPFVSIVVPCRNEFAFITECLDSILCTTWPLDRLEVLVVDGMSDDGTRALLDRYAELHAAVRILDNPQRITPVALNTGIRAARGDVILRMDAHNSYPSEYATKLVLALFESGADNVGGLWITRPGNNSSTARAISLALGHWFGVGNAHYRIGTRERRWVDTVPFGCYRREVFDRIGYFDEELVRNQDDEFNLRLIRNGGRILLLPDVASEYHARETLSKLWRMYFQYGLFKPLVIRKVRGVLTVRQLVPAGFVLALAVLGMWALWSRAATVLLMLLLVVYGGADVFASAQVGRGHEWLVKLKLLIVFPVIHVAYGIGFVRGIVRHLVLARLSQSKAPVVSLTR